MNEKKLIITLIVILVCLNLAGGTYLIIQQKKLNSFQAGSSLNLSSKVSNQPKIEATTPVNQSLQTSIDNEVVQSMIENQKDVTGVIKEINGNSLTLIATVANYKGIERKDPRDPRNTPMEQKELKINTDGNTKFENKDLASLSKNDVITVVSNESISEKNEITAAAVKYFSLDVSSNSQPKN